MACATCRFLRRSCPLLEAMHERAGGVAEVLPVLQGLNENRRAGWMREHFGLAKLDRRRLREETATMMQINFRPAQMRAGRAGTHIAWVVGH
jgi:hypothetical protein